MAILQNELIHRIACRPLCALTVGAGLLTLLLSAPTPAQAFSEDYCREYTRTVWIGGREQEAYGTACLQPDGAWKVVGEDLPDSFSPPPGYVIFQERVAEPVVVAAPVVVRPIVFHKGSMHRRPFFYHRFYSDKHHHHGHED